MTRVKIFGAGSIGNHLSNASRQLGWDVDLCDIDEAALARTRDEIYPGRYGAWDPAIKLYHSGEAPTGGYDYIFVGTPPDSHLPLALQAVAEAPKAVLIEKPLCKPDLEQADEFLAAARAGGVAAFCGYDHAIGFGSTAAVEAVTNGAVGDLLTIDVEFREHWEGIFKAHPWLSGPADTYLGYWQRGGGASGEHSHALNLWQRFALSLGAGRVQEVEAMLDYRDEGGAQFDRICLLNLKTEKGLIGRVVQDVVTRPARKWARLQGVDGAVEWYYALRPGVEAILIDDGAGQVTEKSFEKTRPDDFVQELRHLDRVVTEGASAASPIAVERALETMLVIAAAHRSAQTGKIVRIDYDAGYSLSALSA